MGGADEKDTNRCPLPCLHLHGGVDEKDTKGVLFRASTSTATSLRDRSANHFGFIFRPLVTPRTFAPRQGLPPRPKPAHAFEGSEAFSCTPTRAPLRLANCQFTLHSPLSFTAMVKNFPHFGFLFLPISVHVHTWHGDFLLFFVSLVGDVQRVVQVGVGLLISRVVGFRALGSGLFFRGVCSSNTSFCA
ncbi:uncharacterized protein TRIVIDRAFT_230703, partial [Trichoderma virens Gv29-8]